MKKYIPIIVFACCFGINAQAQVTVKPGIRAGANFSRFTDTDFDFRTDFYAGGFAAIKLTRFYTLQPEITYMAQGAKAEFANPVRHAPKNISVNYISFGVVNKITFNEQFCIMAGPTLDFETGGNVNTNSDVDLAVTTGVGYTLPMGLTIEARVKLGVIDVLESDDYNNSGNYVEDWNTNLVLQIGLSYSFDIKGTTK